MIDLQTRLNKAIDDEDIDDVCMTLDLCRDSGAHVDENSYKNSLKLGAQQGHTGLIARVPAELLDMPLGDLDESAVHIAADHNQGLAVERLVELGANAARPDVEGFTPSVWAAEKGYQEVTLQLLKLQGGTKDADVLRAAARMGHKDLVKELLDLAIKNGDPYTKAERNRAFVAMIAGWHEGSIDVARHLFFVESDELCAAARMGNTKLVRDLLNRASNKGTSYTQVELTSALVATITGGHEGCVDVAMELVTRGADLSVEIKGRPLLAACPRSPRSKLERFIKSLKLEQIIMSAMGGDDTDTAASSSVSMGNPAPI